MKKIIAIVALAVSLSSNAFFNNYNNGYNGYGYNDNGIFGYNPYDAFIDPRWYFEEMSNMMDDFGNFGGNNYNNGYGYNPYYYGNPYYRAPAANVYTAPKTVAKPAAAK
ncbi:hypothetical protein OAL99_04845 [Gammaproteobacteria bacterium]|nr:hypothetical protein [Gammaproteobacteria bacterium]